MSRAGLALRAARLFVTGSRADPTPDYDVASLTYDEAFTATMGRHSRALLARVPFGEGSDVVELACGTGHLTEEIVRRQAGSGTLRVVEKSPGMLAVARAKVEALPGPRSHVEWTEGDMTAFLQALPDDSADAVVCGWAICYSQPVRLFKEIDRVLRPGGTVGIIETRADALGALRRGFEDLVAEEPRMLTGLIRVSLPSDAAEVARWMRKAGLEPDHLDEGEQEWPCRTADDALEWVERSGAGAGFRNSFDMSREGEIRDRLRAILRRQEASSEGLSLRHPFVVAVAHTQVREAVGVGGRA